MIVESLTLTALRNLEDQTLTFDPHVNLIVGRNASGKTSLLEAIHLLSHLRSFRTNNLNQIIQADRDAFQMFAKVHGERQRSQIGIERNRKDLLVRKDFEDVRRRSLLAKLLPVLFIGPDSGQLLKESPRFRRQFIDWGLFQIEPEYHQLWMRYDRALKQRNAALKQRMDYRVFDGIEIELGEAGNMLTVYRKAFIDQLFILLEPLLTQLLGEKEDWELSYHQGYSDEDLVAGLKVSREQDSIRGFTRIGPHRGDFSLKVKGKDVGNYLSRGQLKLTTIALMLAQIALYRQRTSQSTILLMDDMTAELDQASRALLLTELLDQKTQLFITCLEKSEFPELDHLGAEKPQFYYELSDGKAHKMVY